jgi:hypothetical protein
MKATIDFDAALYRRLKMEAARRGRTIRELVDEGVRYVIARPAGVAAGPDAPADDWFGALRAHAGQAGGHHDLAAMRRSVAKARKPRT